MLAKNLDRTRTTAESRDEMVEEVATWQPPPDLHPLAFDNVEMVFDDLGFDWPPS